MERDAIEREVLRLAPWYYLFDLKGVRTDIAPPIHDHVFRTVHFPPVRAGFWRGKTLLDVACNEGAYSFGALDQGVARVDAFDVRAVNVAKARFVKDVLGYEDVDFSVASIDEWLAAHDDTYDFVMLNGILYHLVEPWNVIRDFCSRARQGIIVTCVLHGGDDGYTRYAELDNPGASAGAADSLMPNTTNTLIGEFAKHGFHPSHIQESREDVFWGSCSLFLYRCADRDRVRIEPTTGVEPHTFELHFAPISTGPIGGDDPRGRPFDVHVCGYNLAPKRRTVHAHLRATDAKGAVLHEQGPDAVSFDACVHAQGDPLSQSIGFELRLDLAGAQGDATLEVALCDPDTGQVVQARRLVVSQTATRAR